MSTNIKRSLVKTFLNTGTLVSPVWSLIADGVTTGTINYAPKSTEETYIDQDSASISIDSYAPAMPIEATAKNGDAVFEFIDNLRKTRAVLAAAQTEVVNVWLYKTPSMGYYLAEKQSCSIQIDDFGGDGGAAARINYTINFIGDAVMGSFNPTPTAAFVTAPVLAVLDTLVIGGVTLAPLFATDPTWLWYTGSVATGVTTASMTSTCTADGATVVQYDEAAPVNQGANASLAIGVNHLTVVVTVGDEEVTYSIDVTRAAA